MFNPGTMQDFSKMFDPQAMAKNVQQWCDFNGMAKNSRQNYETFKKISNILVDTYSTCTEKQVKMAQEAMEDCVEGMRDLAGAKGMEELMNRQTEWSKKCAERAQSNAQELAEVMQKGQAQCTDMISKMLASSMEWSKSMMPAATHQNNVQK